MIPLTHDEAYDFYRMFLLWYVQHVPNINYLEIGCANGDNIRLLAPYCRSCTGVDPDRSGDWELYPLANLHYYPVTSDVFFHELNKQIQELDDYDLNQTPLFDLVFIDGDHSFHQVATDLNYSLDHLSPTGLVVLHDTFPPNRARTKPEFCGDAYRILDYLESHWGQKLQHYTFPVTYGLTLVSYTPTLPWEQEPIQ